MPAACSQVVNSVLSSLGSARSLVLALLVDNKASALSGQAPPTRGRRLILLAKRRLTTGTYYGVGLGDLARDSKLPDCWFLFLGAERAIAKVSKMRSWESRTQSQDMYGAQHTRMQTHKRCCLPREVLSRCRCTE